MKSCRVFDDSRVMMKNDRVPFASDRLDPLWIPNSSSSLHGAASMVNFDQAEREICDDEFDPPPEKKRRLTAEQIHFLEKSFDVENKLEPDRKTQLAKELGLQPRQVAIWFQNRRARYKTKLLEKEYDSLKSCYDKLKADYDTLFSDNEKLKNEVHQLSQKLVGRENDRVEFQACSSARSDVFDSDSSVALEIASHVFEKDQSDSSQDEDEGLGFPNLEYDDLQPNSCNLGFPAQNQGTWFWQC